MPQLLIRRAGAFVVDIVLLFLVLFPVGQVLKFIIGWQPGEAPTGLIVWLASALNFSLPTWTYLTLSDRSARGATVGKRSFGLRVARVTGERVGLGRALARTAVKLCPWEMVHLSAFAFSVNPGVSLDLGQLIGLGIANLLVVVYFVVAARTGGRRSIHDYVAGTQVCPVQAKLL
jgi:uncharacterized RDD family membrane protein YckC